MIEGFVGLLVGVLVAGIEDVGSAGSSDSITVGVHLEEVFVFGGGAALVFKVDVVDGFVVVFAAVGEAGEFVDSILGVEVDVNHEFVFLRFLLRVGRGPNTKGVVRLHSSGPTADNVGVVVVGEFVIEAETGLELSVSRGGSIFAFFADETFSTLELHVGDALAHFDEPGG